MHSKTAVKNSKILSSGQRLQELSGKVGTLSELAEESLKMGWDMEEKNKRLDAELQDAQVSHFKPHPIHYLKFRK